jgi:hypothetical protein
MQMDSKTSGWIGEIPVVILVALATALMIAYYINVQPSLSFRDGTGWDGVFYMQMANQFANGEPIMSGKPFVYRIGTPALVAFAKNMNLVESIQQGYFAVNVIFAFLNTILIYLIISTLTNRPFGVIGVLFYIFHWASAPRFAVFAPIGTDQGSLFFLYLGLLTIITIRERRNLLLLLLSVIVGTGLLFREIVLIVPVALVFSQMDPGQVRGVFREGAWRAFLTPLLPYWPPFVAAAVAIFIIRFTVQADPVNGMMTYTFGKSALLHFWLDSPQYFLYAMLTSFGLALVFPLLQFRHVWQYLKSEPFVFAALSLLLVLAYIGGLDLERYINWGFPLFFVVIVKAMKAEKPSLWIIIVISVFIVIFVCRLPWIIPDYDPAAVSPEPIFTFLTDKFALHDLYVIHSEKRLSGHAFYQHLFALGMLALFLRRSQVIAALKPMFGLKP